MRVSAGATGARPSGCVIQAAASSLAFTYKATNVKVTEVEWTCTNDNNEHIQQRARTTTTTSSTTGIVDGVARERNQITGFNLTGWGSKTSTSSSSTDGPTINSCPAQPSTWSLTTPAGDPTVVSDDTTGGLFVNSQPLPITPTA